MRKLGLLLVLAIIFSVIAAPAFADVKRTRPDWRYESVAQMASSTASTVDISTTVPWVGGANTSVYTEKFTLSQTQKSLLCVYLDVTAVNSGTHELTLEGSNDGTNFGVLEEATSVDVTSATTTANMITLQTRCNSSIDAVGNKCIIMRNLPHYKYFRWQLNADASNGPFTATDFSLLKY